MAEPAVEGFVETPYNFGTNHCCNLSTGLYHDYQSPGPSRDRIGDGGIHITNAELKSLLEASDGLQLADELTPIQIWALVCGLDSVRTIDHAVLTALFTELAKHSCCNRCVS